MQCGVNRRGSLGAALLLLFPLIYSCDCGGGTLPGDDSGPRVVPADGGVDASAETDAQVGRDQRVGEADPYNPNNAELDSDCDGLSDAEEFGNVYAGGDQTDPDEPDSDGDGLADGVELGRTSSVDPRCGDFTGDADPTTQTDPTRSDSDGDGLADGEEDANHDGALQAGQELNPRDPDTDDDGACDGPQDVPPVCTGGDEDPFLAEEDRDHDGVADERDGDPDDPDQDGDGLCDGPRDVAGTCVGGEDLNGDGRLGSSETDPVHPDTDCDGVSDADERELGLNPRKRDTDGDLIPDGVEAGRSENLESGYCADPTADADPGSTTDGTAVDSDGDGINDGIEDLNRNGRVDPDETDPNLADTDGDGLCDGPPAQIVGVCTGGEDLNANGLVDAGETNPRVPGDAAADADADGLSDEVETVVECLDPANPDSDGDGVCDGPIAVPGTCVAGEDLNRNGRADPGETDPCDVDSDCDGLVDGPGYGAYLGESDSGTDATNADTDSDGLPDGLELGVAGASIPPGTDAACGFVPDADPTSTTNPAAADSDGDSVPDGAEDANQNGRVDSGELDPNNDGDAAGPVLEACGASQLVPIDFGTSVAPDLLFATAHYGGADAFSERTTVELAGTATGVMFFNPQHEVAAFAVSVVPGGADTTAGAAEQARRATIGNLTAPFTRTFTTWDGFAQSVLASYDDGSVVAVKERANAIVTALVGGAPSGLLTGGGGGGPFKLMLEYVRRTDQRLVIVGALIPAARYTGDSIFRAEDLANGTALAQFGDGVGTQCDIFPVGTNSVVDFLWIIDNSGTMFDEQTTVANTGQEMTTQLGNSTLDWRLGVITTDLDFRSTTEWGTYYVYQHGQTYNLTYNCELGHPPPYWPAYCGFTTDPAAFRGCVASLYICGGGTESAFAPFVCVMGGTVGGLPYCGVRVGPNSWNYGPPPAEYSFLPQTASSAHKLRPGAQLAVIIMTDEPEQSDAANGVTTTVQQWVDFFSNYDGGGSGAFVAGILCPPGENCSCTGGAACTPSDNRYRDFVQAMNGVEADISDYTTIPNAITQIINAAAGSVSPYTLTKPPISSTIKVATDAATAGTCDNTDIPRSREHGWDFDAATGNILFFGDCRPQPAAPPPKVAVSYRYWIDRTPDPGGVESCDCTPPEVCDPLTLECYCPPDCGEGEVSPERVCDTTACELICRPDCGAGCAGNSICNSDDSVCACECPADCGGPAPGPTFICDRDLASATFCEYVCTECPGTPPNEVMTCDLNLCDWLCPDCGDCPGLATCNETTCACDCVQSLSCAAGYRWDSDACDCLCDTDLLECAAGYRSDAAICACVCDEDCGGTCEGLMVCNMSLCACLPGGG